MGDEVWRLFIDESGNFGDGSDSVAVAGWWAGDDAWAPRLRATLEHALPHLPWPPHAAHWQVALFHGLAGAVRFDRLPTGWPRPSGEALALLDAWDSAGLAQAVDALRRDQTVDLAWLKPHDRRLRRDHRVLHATFRNLKQRADERWRELLIALRGGGSGAATPGAAAVGVFRRAPDSLFARNADARYAELAAHCVFLAARRLAHSGVERRLLAIGCTRPYRVSRSQATRAMGLSAWADAIGAPFEDPPVRVEAHSVQVYNRSCHPGLVVADFIANRLRARAFGERDLEHVVPLPWHSAGGPHYETSPPDDAP